MDAIKALTNLELRHVLGQKKVFLLGALLLVPVGLILMMRQSMPARSAEELLALYSVYFYLLYPQTVCILASLLYASTTLSNEIEGRTLTYLFTRPIPKWKIILGKYLGVAAAVGTFTLASVVLGFAAAGGPGGAASLWSFAKTALLAVLVYSAIFTLVGLIFPKRAMVTCLMLAVGEFLLSFVPAIANMATVSHYIRSLAYHSLKAQVDLTGPAGLERDINRIIGDATPLQAYGVLAFMIALSLGLAALLIHTREYSLSDQP